MYKHMINKWDKLIYANNVAILVVSFGTSCNDSRDITIGAIENAISKAFPEYEVRRAFTSRRIIDILAKRDGIDIDNVQKALEKIIVDGIKTLVVQPTYVINGYEYADLMSELKDYEDKFEKIAVAAPLLMTEKDFCTVIKVLVEKSASYDNGETAICFMGHGTKAETNDTYTKLQNKLVDAGYKNYYIGTMQAKPSLDMVIAALKKGNYKRVVLQPLMLAAGAHVNRDMAGKGKNTWKTILEGEGYEVECVMEGLGQNSVIQDVYVEHTRAAAERLMQ